MLSFLLSSPVRRCGVLVSLWEAFAVFAPVCSRLFGFKLGEPEGEAWVSVLGWLVKGNLALPRDPPCVRPPRGACRALRAFNCLLEGPLPQLQRFLFHF